MIHTWIEGTGLVSHISYIGDYDGPCLLQTPDREKTLRLGSGDKTASAAEHGRCQPNKKMGRILNLSHPPNRL